MAQRLSAGAEASGRGAQLPAMFGRYRDGIEEAMRAAMPRTAPDLYPLLEYHMGWLDSSGAPASTSASQGKALRPTLCLFSCEAVGGDWQAALPAAAALEYVHNFSLIHDDIQDGDLERRHRPTVWALWGQPRALVTGDAMLSLSDATMLQLGRSGASPQAALGASKLLMEGYLEMIQGQCLDLSFESDLTTDLSDYLRMVSLKTGALIRCSMAMGALLGCEDEPIVEAFARCGAHLGRAFQVRDDTLGIWGDEAATGKAVGADIRRKKKSLPLVYALRHAGGAERHELERIFGKEEPDTTDVSQVLRILESVGAQEYAHATTCESAEGAIRELASLPLPSWAMAEFQELVDFLTSRQY